jgi:endonuclease/exonuclease/phosphatase (EEP) superfamily protein YafD
MTHRSVSLLVLLLCGCVTLTAVPRAVVSGPAGEGDAIATLPCDAAIRGLQTTIVESSANALDKRPFHLLVWNIHKEGDNGWQRDLATFAAADDMLLLQEVVLQAGLREVLGSSGLRWVLASSFLYDSNDIGVLTATRIAPAASCTQRAMEPLLRIPKSTVITWLHIAGSRQTLAIVNVHAINFDLFIGAYRAEFAALADTIAGHQGPVVLAGDFNTWSAERDQVIAETAARLGLIELTLDPDRRAEFFGRHLDHIFVRGLDVIDVHAIPVDSSDHNPLEVTLRLQ